MKIVKIIQWDMGHRVVHHRSVCKGLHGHRYKAEICMSGDLVSESTASEEGMVIGGGKVYLQVLPMTERIYMTRVNAIVDGDTYFPEINDIEWQVVDHEDFSASESRQFGFSFITLDRVICRSTFPA